MTRSFSGALAALGFLFLSFLPGALAQELRINQISLQGPNNAVIQYDAQANSTYLLLQGNSVNTITTPVATNRGPAGPAQFIQTIPAANRGSYFRIQLSGPPSPPQPVTLIPVSGSSEVGVTVRPKALFPQPVNTATLNTNNFYASFAGQKLPASIVSANDGTFAWLFFDSAMPNSSQIQVSIDGSTILTRSGAALDADADGQPGGMVQFTFSTVSVAPVPGTVLAGRIVDPGRDLQPRTFDDISLDANQNVTFLNPIAGVVVYLLGMEDQFAVTDTNGWFQLNFVPAGDVKLAIEGPAATTPHPGFYWPQMVIDSQTQPGITNYINMIGRDPGANLQYLQTIYLPRIASNVLQRITADATTTVLLQSNAAYDLPPDQQPYLSLQIQPNSLVGMDGQPLSVAQVGLSVVPSELVRDMLPPGLLQHTFDITVQAPGVATFATAAPMTFPNVFNVPPGTKLNFLSFDHTTGRLVMEGTATVSIDGLSVRTDPGTGVTHPGWHGLAPPGVNGSGGGSGGPGPGCPNCPPCPGCPPPSKPKNCNKERELALNSEIECGIAVATIPIGFVASPELGCAISLGVGLGTTVTDCYFTGLNLECGETFVMTMFGSALGCIPGVGGYLGAEWTCGLQAGLAYHAYKNCQASPAALASNGTLPIPQDIWSEQQALWLAAAELYTIILGDPKWTAPPLEDFARHYALFQALQDSVQPSSPGGGRIIQSERDAILQLPAPGNITAADTGALMNRLDQLMSGQVPPGGFNLNALASAASNLVQVATVLQSRGWHTTSDAFVRGIPDLAAQQDQALNDMAVSGGAAVQTSVPTASRASDSLLVPGAFYKLTDVFSGFVQRGRMPNSGRFDQLFMAANSFFTLKYVDPVSARVAVTAFLTGSSGSSFTIPRAIFVEPSSPDTDGDGLSDEAEDVLGTDPRKFSTCGDGISDWAKVQQGLDLQNCLPPPTGIVASLALPGEAKAVVLVGSASNASELTAYLACGTRGLSIVNATKSQSPILLGQLDLPGDAVNVAVDSELKIAAVAALGGGLHLVDIADPQQPKLLQTINANANHVEVLDGMVYAAIDTAVNSYDLLTGELLQSLHLGPETLTGLAREGLFLYTMDHGFVLRIVDMSGPLLVARGSLTMANGQASLFVGNGIAYAPAAETRWGGYATASVSNPDSPTLISGANTGPPNLGPHAAFAANGSGIGLLLGELRAPGELGGPAVVDVMNVSNPANTTAFLARFILPATPFDAAIAAGIAFVADGTAGLQVVNYLPLDSQGVAPLLSISTPSTNALEGSFLPIQIQVSDDVQVRNVELLVNGQVVINDVSFPFDLTAVLPRLAAGSSNVVIQARGTDTGGNAGLSAPITIHLVADTVPPALLSVDPANNTTRGLSLRAVTIRFSEPIDQATITPQSAQLLSTKGPVLPQVIHFRLDGAVAQLTYPALSPGDYQIVIQGPTVKDRAGNALSATNATSRFTIGTGRLAVWTYPSDGFWDVAANWESGVVPGPADDVLIAVPGNVTVTVRQGTNSVHSLASSNAFTITSGSLSVATTIQVDNTFTLTGGTLAGATVVPGAGGQGLVLTAGGAAGTLDGVTLNADTLVSGAPFGLWTVVHGLTVNAALTLASPTTSVTLEFIGTQTLGGTGQVVFGGCCGGNLYARRSYPPVVPATLTIGSGITVHGPASGTVQNGFADDHVINLGTISADAPNAIITFGSGNTARAAINQGTLQALNGGTLDTFNLENAGLVSIGTGGTLTLETGWNNSGTLTLNGGTVNLGDSFNQAALGTFNRTGGTVNIVGTLTEGLRLDAATGSWNIRGRATISGGTVTTSGGAQLVAFQATFAGVTVAGDVTVSDSGILSIDKGLTLASGTITLNSLGSPTYLLVKAGAQTIGGNGEIVMLGSTTANILVGWDGNGPTTLTLGPGVTVRGRGGFSEDAPSTLINQGTIQADVSDKQLGIVVHSVTNAGTIQAIDGGWFNIGTFGTSLVNSGLLTPGIAPNVLIMTGTYTQKVAGVVNIHIGGTTPGTQFSQIQMTGTVALDGTLNLTRINGYEPSLGDTFPIMTYTSATGRFAVVNGLDIGHGKRFDLSYGPTGLTLKVVPAP